MAGVSGAIATRLLRNPDRTLNDREREMWVSNDEGLYNWWKQSRLSMRAFLKENRAELDSAILRVLNAPPREKTWRDYHSNRGGRWYVGLGKGHDRSVFFSRHKPTEKSHSSRFLAVVGPYKSKAEASSKSALMNPLTDAESAKSLHIARKYARGSKTGEMKVSGHHRMLTRTQRVFSSGKALGITGTVYSHGGGKARTTALHVADRVPKYGPNPGSVRAYRVPSGYEAKVASTLRNLFVWAQAQDGRVLTIGKPSIVAKVIRHVCGKKAGTALKNPGGSPENKGRGFYVMGQHTSVAWSLTRADAEREAKRLNYRGGTHYTVVPVGPHPGGGTGALKNSGTEQNVIDVPFGQGKKYSIAQVQKWVETHGTPAMKKRFAMAMTQYKRFHKGSLPKFITYSTYKMGSHPGISDVEFGVSEGHEWMAAYQVPKSSGKWVDQASGGRYVHAHGDSDIDVDVKKPVNLSKLPMRFHTPDGKAVGVIPSKNVKIGEWYEG